MTIILLHSPAAAFCLAVFTAARVMARPGAVRAQPQQWLGRLIGLGAVLIGHGVAGAQAAPNAVAMAPPSCEIYQRARPRGGDFEQLSELFGLSIYRWFEADFTRYRDFLLACGRELPSLRGDVPSDAWDAAVAQSIAQLKEYTGYGQGRPRTQLEPNTPDYTPTFRKMSCDRFTRASIEGWAGNAAPGKIEGVPFAVRAMQDFR